MFVPVQRNKPQVNEVALMRRKTQSFRRQLASWFSHNRRSFPWRNTQNPFHLLVAEILLQKTLAPKAVPAFIEITTRYPTADRLAQAKIRDLKRIVRPLGLVQR